MPSLTIKQSGLTARVFLFSRRVWGDFSSAPYGYWETRTNLCAVIRSIFVLMPLAYTVNAIAVGLCGWAFWWFLYLCWVNLSATAWVFIGVFSVVGFITLLILGKRTVSAIEHSETGHVMVEYYRSKKEKICPLVEIEQ